MMMMMRLDVDWIDDIGMHDKSEFHASSHTPAVPEERLLGHTLVTGGHGCEEFGLSQHQEGCEVASIEGRQVRAQGFLEQGGQHLRQRGKHSV